MRHHWPLFLFIVLSYFVTGLHAQATTLWPKQAQPLRIISLSPSITETLFALGAEDQLVGVTDYCDYPRAATSLHRIGGGLNPNLEAIVSLRPDLVVLSASQHKTINHLTQLNIRTLAVKSLTLHDIRQTIIAIGQASNKQREAMSLLSRFDAQLEMIQQQISGLPRPRVMISMGHSIGNNDFKQFYIAGQQDFYNDLINLAGGENVYQKPFPKVPAISLEGLFHLNPDIIIDIFPEADDHTASIEQVRQQWLRLGQINAIKHDHLYIIEADYATIPGPRIIQLLADFAAIIHPEIDWSKDIKN